MITYLILSFLYALSASTFTISKHILAYSPPLFFIGVRMILAGMVLFLPFLPKLRFEKISSSDFWLFLQICLFHIYASYVFDIWALQYITSSDAALIYCLSPFFTALLSWLWFNEQFSLKQIGAMILGFAGLLPLVYGYHHEGASSLLALGVMILSVLASVYGWIIFAELTAKRNYSPLLINSVGMFFGGIGSLLTSFACESWCMYPTTDIIPFLGWTALIILAGNILFYNLYGYLLRHHSATFLSLAGFLCPIFAALFGIFFLKESINAGFIFSLVTIPFALYFFERGKKDND
jgi:drug/metabolite transporter (DMT)-like permease